MTPVYVVRTIRNYSYDFLATTRFCLAFMHLGYTDSARGDGSKAGALFKERRKRSIELGMRGRSSTPMGVSRAGGRRLINNGNLRVQEAEFALQPETLTA
jgi:hypothetical protein